MNKEEYQEKILSLEVKCKNKEISKEEFKDIKAKLYDQYLLSNYKEEFTAIAHKFLPKLRYNWVSIQGKYFNNEIDKDTYLESSYDEWWYFIQKLIKFGIPINITKEESDTLAKTVTDIAQEKTKEFGEYDRKRLCSFTASGLDNVLIELYKRIN